MARRRRRASRRNLGLVTVLGLLVGLVVGVGQAAQTSGSGEIVQAVTENAHGTITGTVFQDFNADGVMATTDQVGRARDVGVAGILVKGYDSTGALVGTASSGANGTFTLEVNGAVGTAIRIEFEIPADNPELARFRPSHGAVTGASGTTRGGSIQFGTIGDTAVNFAINDPADYCQNSPNLVVSRQCLESNTAPTVWVSRYDGGPYTTGNGYTTLYTDWSSNVAGRTADTGSIHGLTWDEVTGRVFAAAYVRSFSPLYESPIGNPLPAALFVTDPNGTSAAQGTGGSTSFYVDLESLMDGDQFSNSEEPPDGVANAGFTGFIPSNEARNLPFGPDSDIHPDYDGVYEEVGKTGIGDIASDGQGNLYVVSLYTRELYRVAIPADGSPPTEMVSVGSIVQLTNCNRGEPRPFGVTFWRENLYMGVVCDGAEDYNPAQPNSNTDDRNLSYSIVKYTPGAGDPDSSWSSFLGPFPLHKNGGNFKGSPIRTDQSALINHNSWRWSPWTDTFSLSWRSSWGPVYPSPMASDLKFDRDGSVIVSLRDRTGSRLARFRTGAMYPDGTAHDGKGQVSAGDIYRICRTGTGYTPADYVWEGSSGCQQRWDNFGLVREYYRDDYGLNSHSDQSGGMLEYVPGFPEVINTAMDPHLGWNGSAWDISRNTWASSGLSYYLNSTGNRQTGINSGGGVIYEGGVLAALGMEDGSFWKLSGIGDVEALCDQAPIEIGDRLWWDLDADGIQDAGEPGLAGVRVTLYDANGAAIATTITDANGQYWFSSLTSDIEPGQTYVVRFDDPANYRSGGPLHNFVPTEPGTEDPLRSDSSDIDSNGTVPAGDYGVDAFPEIVIAALVPGEVNHSYDLGFTRPVAMGDVIWVDLNGDGIQDPAEPGLPGVVVTLFLSDGVTPVLNVLGQPATATSDAVGFYVIDDLAPGEYIARFEIPNGYRFTVTGSGTPETDSDANPTSDNPLVGFSQIFEILSGPGGNTSLSSIDHPTIRGGFINATIDAGVIPLGSIGDRVWFDANLDGIFQHAGSQSEDGIAGVIVRLRDADGVVVAETVTSETGHYLFEDLEPGTYTVEVEIPAGMAPTIEGAGSPLNDSSGVFTPGFTTVSATTTLAWGSMHDMSVDFGFVPISVQVAGEVLFEGTSIGVAGLTITLYDATGSVVATTTTASDGSYAFVGLSPGEYSTTMTVPDGYSATSTNATSRDLTDHGDADTQLNFTISATPVTVGGLVWSDLNQDAANGEAEPGIPGVTLLITSGDDEVTDIYGQPVGPLLTGPDGTYVFADLLPGTYTITVISPTSMSASTSTVTTSASLNAGVPEDLSLDFGFFLTAPSVFGFVWGDRDGDAIVDRTERGLAGVTVTLYDATGSAIATTLTDSSGRYLFDDLIDNEQYTVEVSPLAGYVASTATTSSVTAVAGGANVNAGFGLQPYVSVGDLVWFDSNRDGIQGLSESAAELGIAGVSLSISVVTADGAIVHTVFDVFGNEVGPVTTDSDGRYVFEYLPVGQYMVSVISATVPAGLLPTLTAIGDRESDSGFETAVSLVLDAAGESDLTLDFGFFAPRVSVGDRVWYDTDNNGIQDPGEPGMAGVSLSITTSTGAPVRDVYGRVVDPVLTDAQGNYLFEDLPPGSYTVSVVTPSGFQPTLAGVGPASTDSSTGSVTSQLLTGDGAQDLTLDFGFWAPSVSVGDFVWFDIDGNGIPDPGEPGLSGVTLRITRADGSDVFDVFGNLVTTTVTDANGNYLFANLPVGTYKVTVEPPTGMTATTPLVDTSQNLASHADSDLTLDFGLTLPFVTVGDFVWLDANADGIQSTETDEDGNLLEPGIEGVLISITTAAGDPVVDVLGNPVDPILTDPDGRYRFTLLPPGQYRVSAETPIGHMATVTGAGDDRSVDSSRGTAVSAVLAGGESDMTLDFGFVTSAVFQSTSVSIGGVVWLDRRSDGQINDDEPGIFEVDLRITDLDGNPVYDVLGNLVEDQTSNYDGEYRFIGLPPGQYVVTVVNPPDGLLPLVTDLILRSQELLIGGESDDVLNFGFRPAPQPTPSAALVEGVVVEGVVGGEVLGQPGTCQAREGIRIWLTDVDGDAVLGVDGEVVAHTYSDAVGQFGFSGLAPGRYIVWWAPDLTTGFSLASAELFTLIELLADGDREFVSFGCRIVGAVDGEGTGALPDDVGLLPVTGSQAAAPVNFAAILMLLGGVIATHGRWRKRISK